MSNKKEFNQIEYITQYQKEHYDLIQIKVSKETHLKEKLQSHAKDLNTSVNAIVLKAIQEYFYNHYLDDI